MSDDLMPICESCGSSACCEQATAKRIADWVRQLGPIDPAHKPERIVQIIADGIEHGDYKKGANDVRPRA